MDTALSLGIVGGLLVLVFWVSRTSVAAAQNKRLEGILEQLVTLGAAQRTVIATKEEYIRELEKTVLGSLPPGKLADRLRRLFPAAGGGAAHGLPTPIRPTGGPKP